jgi:hypothetical protein
MTHSYLVLAVITAVGVAYLVRDYRPAFLISAALAWLFAMTQQAAVDKPYWDDKLGPGWEKRPFPAPTGPTGLVPDHPCPPQQGYCRP